MGFFAADFAPLRLCGRLYSRPIKTTAKTRRREGNAKNTYKDYIQLALFTSALHFSKTRPPCLRASVVNALFIGGGCWLGRATTFMEACQLFEAGPCMRLPNV